MGARAQLICLLIYINCVINDVEQINIIKNYDMFYDRQYLACELIERLR